MMWWAAIALALLPTLIHLPIRGKPVALARSEAGA